MTVRWVILTAAAFLSLAGCISGPSLQPSSRSESSDGTPGHPAAPQFTDIPIPEGASMDLKSTLVLGPTDSWVGRLAMSASRGPSSVFDFYRAEMPTFGWKAMSEARSEVSILTYRRGARIATVQIQGAALGASDVTFTVAPEAGCSGPGGDEGGARPSYEQTKPRSTAVERVR